MVTRAPRFALGALAIVLAAAPAHAENPRLVQARRAVEAVDYEAAQRLLLEALHDGNNSPAAVGEIYRLSARAAIVLGQRDIAEQYYRRWLAIDPGAALPGDTAPKLREPFVAAQAYIAAHGRLLARVQRAPTGQLDIEIVADPLAMARTAVTLDPDLGSPQSSSAPVTFAADHHAHLPAGARVAILDENGNHLIELDATPATTPPSEPPSAPAASTMTAPETAPWTQRWTTWAIPTGAFGLVSAGFGIAAIASYGRAAQIADTSGQYFLSDAEDNVRRGRTFVWITAAAGVVTLACAVPTAIYFLRDRNRARTAVVPTLGDHIGIAVAGSF